MHHVICVTTVRILITLLVWTGIGYAQTSSATVRGTVRDSQSAVIPGATVTVMQTAQGTSRRFQTKGTGEYVVPFLDPGGYSIEVEAAGFKKVVRSGLIVQVADQLVIDFNLEVGEITERVTVDASAPLINAVNNTLGQVIENRRIVDLPINGREPFVLSALAPGVIPAPPNAQDHQGGSIPSISGAANFTSEVTIDGVPNTTPRNQGRYSFLIYTPSVDAVSEFKVQTHSVSAEFGRTNGGVISVVTKSGTNELHGTLYEFHRNAFFDANNFFNNRAGIKLGALHRNQTGGAVGGPVWIPKLYNGKNRTFFFFDFEAFRESTLAQASYTLPTELERRGDFSKTVNAAGAQIVIYDPATTQSNGSGGFVRSAFPGNVIPAARQNTVGKNLINYYPLPTNTRLSANFNGSGAQYNRDDTYDIRMDHYVGSRHKVFGRFSKQEPFTGNANFFNNFANSEAPPLVQHRKNGTVQDVWTLNPTTIVNLSYGISRQYGERRAHSYGFDVTELGFAPSFHANQQIQALPYVTVAGYTAIGTNSHAVSTQMGHTALASLTRIQGSHTLKAGLDYRAYYINQLQNTVGMGNFTFNTNWTQGPNPNQATANAGHGIATLLLGIPAGSLVDQPAIAARSSYWAGFLQDDWKVTRRLTLNLGLRYEVIMPFTERWNRTSLFEVNTPSPIASQVPSIPGLRGVMKFRNADERRLVDADGNNFGPRIGFALQLPKSIVLRGGYGILYGLSTVDAKGTAGGFLDGFQTTTNINTSVDGVTPVLTLSNPFPAGYNKPVPASQLGPNTLLGQANSSALLSVATPYFQQWNLSIQKSLTNSLLMEVAYAANKGTHLQSNNLGLNSLTFEQTALGTFTQQLVPNPFFGIINDPTSSLSLPTVQRGQLMRPYPQYSGVTAITPSIGNSIYHSLQVRMEKRLARGFTVLGAYTFSKNITDATVAAVGSSTTTMDVFNLRLERSPDAQDIPQRLVISGLWELPFGKGRAIGSGVSRPVDWLIGSWQLNGIAAFQAGEPLAMSVITGTRPIRLLKDPRLDGPTQQRLDRYYDSSAFAVPAAFTFGNTSRTEPKLRAPGVNNFDFSMLKTLPLHEKLRAQLRLEAFNAFNRVWFAQPARQIGSVASGVISAQANRPRQLQVALKLIF